MNRLMNLKQAVEIIKITNSKKYKSKSGKLIDVSNDLQKSVNNSFVYKPSDFKDISMDRYEDTILEVVEGTTTGVILNEYKDGINIVALNFANATTPGGGFLVGHNAQEESIFRNSLIIPSIKKCKEFYKFNNRNLNKHQYTNCMIYSSNVPVIRDDFGNFIKEPVYASFITSPAVFAVYSRVAGVSEDEITDTMRNRIDKILQLSYEKKADVLVLGAYGCGEFKNNPETIARLFNELIKGKYKNKFKKIIFAIYDKTDKKTNLEIFKKELNK